MKIRFCAFFVLAALCAGLVSCDKDSGLGGGGVKNVAITEIQFGPTTDSKIIAKLKEAVNKLGVISKLDSEISPFLDEEKFKELENYDPENEKITLSGIQGNRITFDEDDQVLFLKTLPQNAYVSGFTVESSDESVIKITGQAPGQVSYKTVAPGYAKLKVTVHGSKNTLVRVYPVKVINSIDMRYFITPYWYGNIKTCIRWKPRHASDGITHDLVQMTDSVTIISYCEWYDFRKFGRTPQVERDTITLPMVTRYESMRRWTKKILRDITPQVRQIRTGKDSYIKGNWVEHHTTMYNDGHIEEYDDTTDVRYHYIVEQVILDINAFPEDEFVELLTSIRSGGKRKNNSIISGAVIEDSDGNVAGGDESTEEDAPDKSVDESDEDGPDDFEITREEIMYFQVRMNDFLTESQRDSVRQSIRDMKDRYGITDDMDPDEKDALLDKINTLSEEGSN